MNTVRCFIATIESRLPLDESVGLPLTLLPLEVENDTSPAIAKAVVAHAAKVAEVGRCFLVLCFYGATIQAIVYETRLDPVAVEMPSVVVPF